MNCWFIPSYKTRYTRNLSCLICKSNFLHMVYCTSLLCVCVYTVMCLCVSMCLCVFHGMHVDTRGQLEVYQSSYFNMHVIESIVARRCGHQSSRPMSFRDSWHRIAEIIDAHGHTQGSEDLNSGPHAYTANMLPTESSPQPLFIWFLRTSLKVELILLLFILVPHGRELPNSNTHITGETKTILAIF